jgi:hypothetical protein
MKITNNRLRRVIREQLILNEAPQFLDIVTNPYEDVDDINILANYALRDDMQGALKDKELQYYIDKNEAALLVDDSMGWIGHVGEEQYEMPAPEGWDEDKIYAFMKKFEDEAYKVYSKKAKAASAAAPNRAERKAIGRAFTYDDVSEDEIAYITFQLRRKGGKVVNINMEDHDSRLGNMTTGISEEEALRLGTTLDKIEKTLRDGDAKERKKRKPVKRSTPYYD